MQLLHTSESEQMYLHSTQHENVDKALKLNTYYKYSDSDSDQSVHAYTIKHLKVLSFTADSLFLSSQLNILT